MRYKIKVRIKASEGRVEEEEEEEVQEKGDMTPASVDQKKGKTEGRQAFSLLIRRRHTFEQPKPAKVHPPPPHNPGLRFNQVMNFFSSLYNNNNNNLKEQIF